MRNGKKILRSLTKELTNLLTLRLKWETQQLEMLRTEQHYS